MRAALIALAWMASSTSAYADAIPNAVGFQVENDLFGSGLDRHYTNGLQVYGVVGSDTVPQTLRDAMTALPGIDVDDDKVFVLGMGQHMYTPSDITRATPAPTDRPYAGWTYLSISAAIEDKDRGGRLHDVALDVGVVGPLAGAGKVQRRWHALIDTTTPQGWGHQLANEPGVLLTYQTRARLDPGWRPVGLEVDVSPAIGAALGNVFTYANVGGSVRMGRNLSLTHGAPFIRPSLPAANVVRRKGMVGWNVFAGVDGRWVVRNIFLDGNTFRGGPSVSKRPLVLDFQAGIEFIYKDVRVSFTQTLRTREFDGQENPDRFGSLGVTFVF